MIKKMLPVAAAVLVLSSCALGEEKPKSEPAGGGEGRLKGASFKVGSKEFTEQLVLCEITAQVLEAEGATADRSACKTSGSKTVRDGLEAKEIDMYWEYTGTSWTLYLQHDKPIPDAQKQYDEVAKEDLEKNKIKWLDPAPGNNSYGLIAKTTKAQELGVSTISEYAALAKSDPAKASLCGAAEFLARNDGFPGIEKAYDFNLDKEHLSKMELGLIPTKIADSDPCNFGEMTTTDGRIKSLGLTVLEDDKKFFPIYNPALTVRQEVFEKNPKLAEVFAPISKALTDEALIGLNGKVDEDGEEPEDVAEAWLKEQGVLK